MDAEIITAYVDWINVVNLGNDADYLPASVMQLVLFETFYQNINCI